MKWADLIFLAIYLVVAGAAALSFAANWAWGIIGFPFAIVGIAWLCIRNERRREMDRRKQAWLDNADE